MPKKGLSRREVLRLSPLVVAGAVLAACGPRTTEEPAAEPPKSTPSYPPEFTPTPTFPETVIDEQRLQQIIDRLKYAHSPFLAKIMTDSQKLHTTTTPPTEMPTWVGPRSFPLVITTSEGFESSVGFDFTASSNPADAYSVGTKASETYLGYSFSQDGLGFYIHLGLAPLSTQKNGPIIESIWLAKEEMSLAVALALARDYSPYLQTQGYHFYDPAKNEITDPTRLNILAASRAMVEMSMKGTPLMTIIEALPILLIGSTLTTLADHKEFPEESFGVRFLVRAAQLVEADPELKTMVNNLTQSWMNNGTILPPDLFSQVAQPKMYNAISAVFQEMFEPGARNRDTFLVGNSLRPRSLLKTIFRSKS